MVLERGQNFNVGIVIENYDKKEKSGKICILDDLSDGFSGISSDGEGECYFFNVKGYSIISSNTQGGSNSQSITPGITEVYFPTNGIYSYNSLPQMGMYNGRLFVRVSYRESPRATTTLSIPSESQPIIHQDPSQISVSLNQLTYKINDGYRTDLTFNIIKKGTSEIYNSDFSKENIIYFNAEVPPKELICADLNKNVIQEEFELSDTGSDTIKCSFLSSSNNAQSYPLVLNLDYGVILEKEYSFQIKTDY
jgi:hypothetical protein